MFQEKGAFQPTHTHGTTAKAVPEGKFMQLNADIKKEENSQIN